MSIGDREKHRRYFRRARHLGADDGTLEIWELLREFHQNNQTDAGTAEHEREIVFMDAVIRLNPNDGDAP